MQSGITWGIVDICTIIVTSSFRDIVIKGSGFLKSSYLIDGLSNFLTPKGLRSMSTE